MNDMAYCAIPSAWLVEAGNTTAAAADDDEEEEEEEEERERKPREETPSLLRRDKWLEKSVTGIAAADMASTFLGKNNNGASSTVAAPGRYYR